MKKTSESKEISLQRKIELKKSEIATIAIRHAKLEEKLKGPEAIVEFRKHLCWYAQGVPGASQLRGRLVKVFKAQEVKDIFQDWVKEKNI